MLGTNEKFEKRCLKLEIMLDCSAADGWANGHTGFGEQSTTGQFVQNGGGHAGQTH